ncbi:unnamed protein product, partial [Cylicostephanus goldi]
HEVVLADSKGKGRLEKSDPKLLDKLYLVQGSKLLELFHISRCGCEENKEEEAARLVESGSVPVIIYTTEGSETKLKQWQGRWI